MRSTRRRSVSTSVTTSSPSRRKRSLSASTVAFSVLPASAAALLALPCLGLTLSVFVPVLLYLTPRRIGSAAAPRAIGYQVAAGMIGGASLPAVVGLLMQSIDVAVLGPCLVTMATVLAALHIASTRSVARRATSASSSGRASP